MQAVSPTVLPAQAPAADDRQPSWQRQQRQQVQSPLPRTQCIHPSPHNTHKYIRTPEHNTHTLLTEAGRKGHAPPYLGDGHLDVVCQLGVAHGAQRPRQLPQQFLQPTDRAHHRALQAVVVVGESAGGQGARTGQGRGTGGHRGGGKNWGQKMYQYFKPPPY